VNQDFREISKMITPHHVRVTLHPHGTEMFASRDIRVKNRYVTN
jgi:UV DNA damage repair endonuclease